MKKEYKALLINSLYGFMEGNMDALTESIKWKAEYFHKVKFDKVSVVIEDYKVLDKDTERVLGENESFENGFFAGKMVGTIEIEGETFTHTRDLHEEYKLDMIDPNYSNEWGGNGNSILWDKALKEIGIENHKN